MFDLTPFDRNERKLWNQFMNLDFFDDFDKSMRKMRTDVIDKGDRYILEAELPGFSKEDIKLDIEGDYLTICAEHSEERSHDKKDFVHRERRYGSFTRSFNIADVKAEEIKAKYKGGILELDMPKKDGSRPSVRRIDIE